MNVESSSVTITHYFKLIEGEVSQRLILQVHGPSDPGHPTT
jgi:hypothetical protein